MTQKKPPPILALGAVAAALFAAGIAHAEPPTIPGPLEPWARWVAPQGDAACPHLPSATEPAGAGNALCLWPSRLALTLGDGGGSFDGGLRAEAKTWAPLPGDAKHWPQEVTVDGKRVVVLDRGGRPFVELLPGEHRVAGKLLWEEMPPSIAVPADTALLDLTLRGAAVPFPQRDADGTLYLAETKRATDSESRLDIVVHRKITDGAPLLLATRLRLEVSGKSREVVFGKPLPAGFIAHELRGGLPARLEADGKLRVQVRPGTFEILIISHADHEVVDLARPDPQGLWRDGDEIWTFEGAPTLRTVTVSGAPSIDPKQTTLDEQWRTLPAYIVPKGGALHFGVERRGDADGPASDRLTLVRNLWLDFDGNGFTTNDEVTGTLRSRSRLDMRAPYTLGRAAVNGSDQFITATGDPASGGGSGIEVRDGRLVVNADARLNATPASFPATGWDHDFSSVSATLHLPPGFRIFHASGADEVPGTWIGRWTLLELFLVLLLTLGTAKLRGRWTALLALCTFAMTFPEAGAPKWLWAAVLAFDALAQSLPSGKFRKVSSWIFRGFLAISSVVAIAFLVGHIRGALHPALAHDEDSSSLLRAGDFAAKAEMMEGGSGAMPAAAPVSAADQAPAEAKPKDGLQSSYGGARKDWSNRAAEKQSNSTVYDPNAAVQTGPGRPLWSGHTVPLRWSGPVSKGQDVHLYVVGPLGNGVLGFVRLALLVGLLVRFLPAFAKKKFDDDPPAPTAGDATESSEEISETSKVSEESPAPSRALVSGRAMAILAGLALFARSGTAHADVPSKEVLDELKGRLYPAPTCGTNCASIDRIFVDARATSLLLRLDVGAAASTTMPLPGGAKAWTPSRVTVDGKPAPLARDGAGVLRILLDPGPHAVVLEGAFPDGNAVQVPLPLLPHRGDVKAEGWKVSGVHDGICDDTLQFTRIDKDEAKGDLQAGTLPALLVVDRTLRVGLDWRVDTVVQRKSPLGAPVVAEITLLPGEAPTTAELRTERGKAFVTLGPNEAERSWTSVLPGATPGAAATDLLFAAPKDASYMEIWHLDVSPIWHVEWSGTPVARIGEQPAFYPYPGETLTAHLTRPSGTPGRTVTVDHSNTVVRPGLRTTEFTLQFTLRASRGLPHIVTLPEGARIDGVKVGKNEQPQDRGGRTVRLLLAPGTQDVEIRFHLETGITNTFSVPAIDLGTASVNATVEIALSDARWPLFVNGPRLGPAVLFWSLLLVLAVVAFALDRFSRSATVGAKVPVVGWQWFLLAIGLSQVSLLLACVVVAWLFALGRRAEPKHDPESNLFNLRQVGLAFLTLVALGVLVGGVTQGLLGRPEMQIEGNGSSNLNLIWFQDRADGLLPQPTVYSAPTWIYRLAMLAWASWLAWQVVAWLRWGFGAFGRGGFWKKSAFAAAAARPGATAVDYSKDPRYAAYYAAQAQAQAQAQAAQAQPVPVAATPAATDEATKEPETKGD